jgi:hypothetical protein
MPKDAMDIVDLEKYLTSKTDALSLGQIAQRFPKVSKRTLQRWLTQLKEQGQVKFDGEKRGRKYLYIATYSNQSDHREGAQTGEVIFSKAKQSVAALSYINQPLEKREPVGYNEKFLVRYEPNKTKYLSDNEKDKLYSFGRFSGQALPAGTLARQILQRLLIDLSWNSSRLEGNTYSLLDTKKLIEFGKIATGKQTHETQMIYNHKQAIEYLLEVADDSMIRPTTIKNLHAMLAENLLADPRYIGALRSSPVAISGSTYIPVAVPQKINELFITICDKASKIDDSFERSFFLFLHLPYLQPFQDVNKRVARLAANIPFIRSNLSPLSFVDLPIRDYALALLSFYETTDITLPKEIFCWAYQRSAKQYQIIHQTLGDPDPFRIKYREELKQVVQKVVLSLIPISELKTTINQLIPDSVDPEERNLFTEYLRTELQSLHEGNYARFRLKPSEYEAWEKLMNRKQ